MQLYKDTLKASLDNFNITLESWEQAAQDRSGGAASTLNQEKIIREAENQSMGQIVLISERRTTSYH